MTYRHMVDTKLQKLYDSIEYLDITAVDMKRDYWNWNETKERKTSSFGILVHADRRYYP